MNEQGEWRLRHTERAVTGILRAMEQLLLTLAGDEDGKAERARSPRGRRLVRPDGRVVREEPVMPEPRSVREPRFAPPPMPKGGDDVELMLADARARAHELIDGSVGRAQEVLSRGPQSATEGEALRRTIAELVADIRTLHRRLEAIEELLRAPQAARAVTRAGIARLEVSDAGPGIATDDRARIFEPFYQVRRPGAAEVPGSGLGLAVARRLVELQSGCIWVEGSPSGGSCFCVELASAAQADATARRMPADTTPVGEAFAAS